MRQNTAGNNLTQDAFTTGATRSTSEDKIDFEGHINPEVLAIYGAYMHAHRVQRNGQLRASDNWQQGIPVYRYMKSLIRHVYELHRMWRGASVYNPDSDGFFTMRDVLCAILFNTMGILYELSKNSPHMLNQTDIAPGIRQALESVDQAGPCAPPTAERVWICAQDGEVDCCPGNEINHNACRQIAASKARTTRCE